MGVGGEFGIGMAIVTETWSKEMRAKATSVVALGWQFGVLIASLLPDLLSHTLDGEPFSYLD